MARKRIPVIIGKRLPPKTAYIRTLAKIRPANGRLAHKGSCHPARHFIKRNPFFLAWLGLQNLHTIACVVISHNLWKKVIEGCPSSVDGHKLLALQPPAVTEKRKESQSLQCPFRPLIPPQHPRASQGTEAHWNLTPTLQPLATAARIHQLIQNATTTPSCKNSYERRLCKWATRRQAHTGLTRFFKWPKRIQAPNPQGSSGHVCNHMPAKCSTDDQSVQTHSKSSGLYSRQSPGQTGLDHNKPSNSVPQPYISGQIFLPSSNRQIPTQHITTISPSVFKEGLSLLENTIPNRPWFIPQKWQCNMMVGGNVLRGGEPVTIDNLLPYPPVDGTGNSAPGRQLQIFLPITRF